MKEKNTNHSEPMVTHAPVHPSLFTLLILPFGIISGWICDRMKRQNAYLLFGPFKCPYLPDDLYGRVGIYALGPTGNAKY